MNNYHRVARKISVFTGAIGTFKDWPTWLGFRLGWIPRNDKERIFRIRDGSKFYYTGAYCSGAGYFQELYLQNGYFQNYRLKDGDVVVDIGAHIGIFSIIAARSGKNLRIFSYEPSPKLYALLQRNIPLNGFQDSALPFPFGVGEKEGSSKFYAQDLVSGTTIWEGTGGTVDPENYISVNLTTLEKIFEANQIERCDFMKMDCEGAEFPTLLNAPSSVLKKISHMAIEYHMPPAPIIERLNREGFKTQLGPATGNNVGMLYADRI